MSEPRLKEVFIFVSDLDGAIDAWRRASGLEAKEDVPGLDATIAVEDVEIRLMRAPDAEDLGLFSLDLAVDNLDAFVTRLRSSGITLWENVGASKRWFSIYSNVAPGFSIHLYPAADA